MLKRSLIMFIAGILVSCSQPGQEAPGDVLEDEGGPDPCANLSCPLGSTLRLDVTPCLDNDSPRLTKDTTTGLCIGGELCALACDFAQPCLCGVEDVSANEIACAACTVACGDGLCEPGEDATNCERDCGTRCHTGTMRCHGAEVETCNASGQWDAAPCSANEICRETAGSAPECVLCDVTSPPLWHVDRDGDGFGDPDGATLSGCLPPERFVLDDTDCDDASVGRNPLLGCVVCTQRIDCEQHQNCDLDSLCACEADWGDCNGDRSDGCEAFIRGEDAHCGVCGVSCSANTRCVHRQCRPLLERQYLNGGRDHTCVIRAGQVWCWGSNTLGQLGNLNNSADGPVSRVDGRLSPVPVRALNLPKPAVSVAVGNEFSCALLDDAALWCWGYDGSGALGNGSGSDASSSYEPTLVEGVQGVVDFDVGASHGCAVLDTGEVWCWGNNSRGQIGDGIPTSDPSSPPSYPKPIAVVGITNAVSVSVGTEATGHSCATLEGGTLRCWGDNLKEELGNPLGGRTGLPVDVLELTEAAQDVAAGGEHTCALLNSGAVQCWGNPSALGRGGANEKTVWGIDTAIAVTAGGNHACALLDSGHVQCWGNNGSGQLGDGTGANRSAPVDVLELTNAVAIAAGTSHTCALLSSGDVECWGANAKSQLGDGSTANVRLPLHVSTLDTETSFLDAGYSQTCAVSVNGSGWCWGNNGWGQLGDGTTATRPLPTQVQGLTDTREVHTGGENTLHSCALLADGRVRCWGSNFSGEFGTGSSEPDRSSAPGADVKDLIASTLAVGGSHVCATLSSGGIQCWGRNASGQVGSGNPAEKVYAPEDVMGITNSSMVSAGDSHSCAVLMDGGVRCWGRGSYGRLGDGTDQDRSTPVDVANISTAVWVAAGGGAGGHSCAVLSDGAVWCWGNNQEKQLGRPGGDSLVPVKVRFPSLDPPLSAVLVTTGDQHSCALLEDENRATREVWCWGSNAFGQLGTDSAAQNMWEPMPVPGLFNAQHVSAGRNHTCALNDAAVYCWGNRSSGALGDGSTNTRSSPVSVVGLPEF